MGVLGDLAARGRRRDTFTFDVAGTARTVEFQAVSPRDYETLTAAHTGDDGTVQEGWLPALAAACAVDPDDQDETVWASVVEDVLNPGEENTLRQFLILLNWGVPGPGPKGA